LDYKNNTSANFASVFAGGDGGGSQFYEKWKWYPILYTLANNDILQMDKVTELPVHVVLQHLAFLKDLATEQKKR